MKAASMVGEDSSSRGTANEIAAERSAPVDDLADHTNKLTELLDQLGHKVKEEIKDPSKRDSPQVLFDVKLFLTVKDSVDKTKALIAAAGVALREAKHAEERQMVKEIVRKGMLKVRLAY